MAKQRKRLAVEERFWEKVQKGLPDACWLWQGAVSDSGYGSLHIMWRPRKAQGAHKFSYMLAHGEVPKGMEVLHSCDNKLCVNPAHLSAGTRIQNMLEASARGLLPRGARHWKTPLTAEAVQSIRRRYAAGERQRELAAEFGVRQPAISNIVRGARWHHLQVAA